MGDRYAPMGTYSPQNLSMMNYYQYNYGKPNAYPGQSSNQYGGGGAYSSYPRYVSSNKMVGPQGYVPVYDKSECLNTKKGTATLNDYNDYKTMAKMDNDPFVIAIARMEADAQFKDLNGYSDAGHEYYTNKMIQNLEPRKK